MRIVVAAGMMAAFANADSTTSYPHTIVSLPSPSLLGPTARPTAVAVSIPTIAPTVFPSSLFASVLSISDCPTPILPSATSVTGLDGDTTAILTVQCDASRTFNPARPTNCHAAIGIGPQLAFCCPMGAWSLTAFGTSGLSASTVLPYYCFTSISGVSTSSLRPIQTADPTAFTQKVKRQVSAPLSTGSAILDGLIFVKAATTSLGVSSAGTTVVGAGGTTTTMSSMQSTTQSTTQAASSTAMSTTMTSTVSTGGSSTTATASTTKPSSSTAGGNTSATSSATVGAGSGADGRSEIFGSAISLLITAGAVLLAIGML